jgi:hypothetical protein
MKESKCDKNKYTLFQVRCLFSKPFPLLRCLLFVCPSGAFADFINVHDDVHNLGYRRWWSTAGHRVIAWNYDVVDLRLASTSHLEEPRLGTAGQYLYRHDGERDCSCFL